MKDKIYQYKLQGKKRTRCPKCGKFGVFVRYVNPENSGGAYKHNYKLGAGGMICDLIDVCFFSENEISKVAGLLS